MAPSSSPSQPPTTNPSSTPSNPPSLVPSSSPSSPPSLAPSQSPTTLSPTPPGTLGCGDTQTGDYNSEPVTFIVNIPYQGDIQFDASNSIVTIAAMNAYKMDDTPLADDMDGDQSITLSNRDAGNYKFIVDAGAASSTYDVRVTCTSDSPTPAPTNDPSAAPSINPSFAPTQPPTLNPSFAPSLTPSFAPSSSPSQPPTLNPSLAPSNSPSSPSNPPSLPPSESPTTLSPTPPGTLRCGDTHTGEYNAQSLTFYVNIPYQGDIRFDARNSVVPIATINAYDMTNTPLADDTDGDKIVTLSNRDAGNYKFIVDAGTATSTYDVRITCTSDSPTQVPSSIPTKSPTIDPSVAPSLTPSLVPSSAPTPSPTSIPTRLHSVAPAPSPTMSPTMSPTTCLDFGSYEDTNDGTDEWTVASQTNINFMYQVGSSSMILSATDVAAFAKENVYLNEAKKHLVCEGLVSCLQSDIIGSGTADTFFNIECIGEHSCNAATLTIHDAHSVHLICNGDAVCMSMVIDIQNINSMVVIDCVTEQSCSGMTIKLNNNKENIITCYLLNACDDISIETTNYMDTTVKLYSYSHNITFDNGFGLNPAKDNLECILPNRYIRYDSTLANDAAQVMTRIANEYIGNKFACDDVQMICDENKADAIETQYCTVAYTVTPLSMPVPFPQCYWVSISELIAMDCHGNCVLSPTEHPTNAPSFSPTAATSKPTNAPSSSPTLAPSSSPTSKPTVQPSYRSIAPTLNPSVSPSNAPTASPTRTPTHSSVAPSFAPSTPPTFSPTRLPTQEVDKIYDKEIEIEYEVKNLTADNKYFIVRNTRKAIAQFEGFIEKGLLDKANDLRYKDFWCHIYEVNDKNVETVSADADGDNLLTVYDLDILDQNPKQGMILSATIECDDANGEIIIKRTGTRVFRESVQESFATYFDNSDIGFSVLTSADSLEEISKFDDAEKEDYAAMYVSVVIVSMGAIVSFSAFIYNHAGDSKVDHVAFIPPVLIGLGLYCFIGDVNLAIHILNNPEIEYTVNNIYVWLGLLSILSIALSFAANLVYAKTIKTQKCIRESPNARKWFAAHLGQFILICILSSGAYPALLLCNSRIFDLEFFGMGLFRSDLQQLSKIKMRSTLFMQNCPQLLIQAVYSIARNKLENATILAFVASALSVVVAAITYQARKNIDEETVIAKYFVGFANVKQIMDEEQREKISCAKGYTMRLGKGMCEAFGIAPKSIEIGYIAPNKNGCIVRLQHCIFKDSLEQLKDKLVAASQMQKGFTVQITPELYVEKLYGIHKKEITDVFRNHFDIHDTDFTVRYHKRYEDANRKKDVAVQRPLSAVKTASVSVEGAGPRTNNETDIIDEIAKEMMKMDGAGAQTGVEMAELLHTNQPNIKMMRKDQNIVDTFTSLQQLYTQQMEALQRLILENMMSEDAEDGGTEMKEEEKESEVASPAGQANALFFDD